MFELQALALQGDLTRVTSFMMGRENSLFVCGSGMSDGNVHNHLNLPVLVAGNAGGQLKGGRHIQAGQLAKERAIAAIPKFDKMMPIANLMVSVQQLFGVEAESYGVDQCASNGSVSLA